MKIEIVERLSLDVNFLSIYNLDKPLKMVFLYF